MPNLYPALVAPEDFRPGDVVRKMFGDRLISPYLGVVLAVHPTTQTVDVKWPFGIGFEPPQDLIRVNPDFFPPTVGPGQEGYYPTLDSDKWRSTGDPEEKAPKTGSEKTRELLRKDSAIRVAHHFVCRSLNYVLRTASHTYNEGYSELATYNFIFKKLGKAYPESLIRKVVSYLYETTHNYFEEEFDLILKQGVASAQDADKKTLSELFKNMIELTGGKKGAKVTDLIDDVLEHPIIEVLLKNLKQAVRKSGGNLDLLPTPGARFASKKKAEEVVFTYRVAFKDPEAAWEFGYDAKKLLPEAKIRPQGKKLISLDRVSEAKEKEVDELISKDQGTIAWKDHIEVSE